MVIVMIVVSAVTLVIFYNTGKLLTARWITDFKRRIKCSH